MILLIMERCAYFVGDKSRYTSIAATSDGSDDSSLVFFKAHDDKPTA